MTNTDTVKLIDFKEKSVNLGKRTVTAEKKIKLSSDLLTSDALSHIRTSKKKKKAKDFISSQIHFQMQKGCRPTVTNMQELKTLTLGTLDYESTRWCCHHEKQ